MKPIFKNKGSPADVEGYRPISLLSCISKIFEKIVFKRIYNHITEHNLLTERQSGYRPGHGTQLQLFYLTHSLYENLDDGKDHNIIYLDISRYFEKIWHKGLLHKCEHEFGLANLIPWLTSYLTNRHQRVVINNSTSSLRPLQAGCPQGSVLGPLLALMYLNNLSTKTENEMLFFADDACLIAPHSPNNRETVESSLQRDLNEIHKYGDNWMIQFNPRKTLQQHFTKRKQKIPPKLTFAAMPIPVVANHKHLGLTISNDLRFHEHINDIIRKVNIALSPLYRIASYLPRTLLQQIYTTHVLPYFDYADIIYDGLLTVLDT